MHIWLLKRELALLAKRQDRIEQQHIHDSSFFDDVVAVGMDSAVITLRSDQAPHTDWPFSRLSDCGFEVLVRSGSPIPVRILESQPLFNMVVLKPGSQYIGKKQAGLRARAAGQLTRGALLREKEAVSTEIG